MCFQKACKILVQHPVLRRETQRGDVIVRDAQNLIRCEACTQFINLPFPPGIAGRVAELRRERRLLQSFAHFLEDLETIPVRPCQPPRTIFDGRRTGGGISRHGLGQGAFDFVKERAGQQVGSLEGEVNVLVKQFRARDLVRAVR